MSTDAGAETGVTKTTPRRQQGRIGRGRRRGRRGRRQPMSVATGRGPDVESVDASGKTVDEAIEKALAQLGLERTEVDVEVVKEGRSGILGIGGEEARVVVTPRGEPARDGAQPSTLPELTEPGEDEVALAVEVLEKLLAMMEIDAARARPRTRNPRRRRLHRQNRARHQRRRPGHPHRPPRRHSCLTAIHRQPDRRPKAQGQSLLRRRRRRLPAATRRIVEKPRRAHGRARPHRPNS